MDDGEEGRKRIMIVGNCAAGKSTLAQGLRRLGYYASSFSQEHSYSAKIWKRRNPDVLILLRCRYTTIQARRRISWGQDRYQRQQDALSHARAHAHLIVETDGLEPQELIDRVHCYLTGMGVRRQRIDNA